MLVNLLTVDYIQVVSTQSGNSKTSCTSLSDSKAERELQKFSI